MIRCLPGWALAVTAALAGGCQHDIATPFPPGLEPFEDNPLPAQAAPYAETLATATDDSGYIHAYALGYVKAPLAAVWAAAQDSAPNVARCSTDEQQVSADDEPQYTYSFLVHYVVHNLLTIEWDDRWRFGVVRGAVAAPALAMIKHQKTEGSSFIKLSEGTIALAPAPDDPDVTALSFVEHLDAYSASDADVLKNMRHNYAALVAVTHGDPIPACP